MSQAPPTVKAPPQPVMGTTQYDKASAGMIAAVAGLLGLTALLVAVWFTNRIPAPPEPVPFEIVEMPGGYEDGSPDETMELESPEEEVPDPAIAETVEEQTQIQEMLETIVELSDSASQEVETLKSDQSANSGQVGSASGTGGRPLGMGGGGKGGIGREQRWRIKFDDADLETYAKQLDFFKIELGALFKDGRLVFIKDMSKPRPAQRVVQTGKGEDRLYMTWRGGSRKKADASLFKKAGVANPETAMLMHFYAPETEQLLARTEVAYRNRKSTEIRSTYFSVRKDGPGYKFVVTSQSYLSR